MIKIIEFFQKIEKWIGGLWKCEFYIGNQKLNFGSWKVLITIPSHIVIGFIVSFLIFCFVGIMWKSVLIGGLSSALMLEGKDLYKYISKNDYTMFLQGAWDMMLYIFGAVLFAILF
jgi:hypothetical protein